jgi:UDP-N-acetylmuramoyl-tripeptide--D-alanyl-D-alanine ligase
VIPLNLAEVSALTGGTPTDGADPEAVVTGPVVADSRQVVPGALFAALPGERVDGHDYAAATVTAGAVAALTARPVGAPAVVVDDPLTALGRLARGVVDRCAGGLTVIGVTGSSGKTTTKDLIAALLARVGPTIAPEGSFNNELGLPLTLLRVDAGTRFAVAEMGSRGPGHIAYLCGIAAPRIGVVLNVGAAHAGVFGGPEATAAAKGELVEALPADGVAVLNVDDPRVRAMAARTRARIVGVGASADADVRATGVRLDEAARASFRLHTPVGEVDVRLGVHGAHQVGNALAAAAVAVEAGLDLDGIAAGLAAAGPASRWRMEVHTRPDGIVVVNDAYNANPDSVRAALHALTAVGGPGRRRWAVLGQMLELGEDGPDQHARIGALARDLGVARLIAVGEEAAPFVDGYAAAGGPPPGGPPLGEASPVADLPAALDLLRAELAAGDVVLVKASRAVGLDRLAAQLMLDALGPQAGGSSSPNPSEEVTP